MRSETLAVESWSAVRATAACRARPGHGAARQVGHGDQGFPVVGGAVFQRHGRFGSFQLGQVRAEPVRRAARPGR